MFEIPRKTTHPEPLFKVFEVNCEEKKSTAL